MKAMVLAAGVGSRLDPLTTELPKPLAPVANRPVMEHILGLLKQHHITDIASNLYYLPEKIKAYFGAGDELGVKLSFRQEAVLSGDAGGVRACREFLQDDTFLVVMGDLLTDADLSYVVSEHKRKGALATIALKQVEDVTQFGVALTDESGFVTGFQEKPTKEEALSHLISTGIYVLEPDIFKYIPDTGTYGFGRQLFPKLVANSLPVLGVVLGDYWSDVGTLRQYRQSNFDALTGKVKLSLPGNKTEWGWAEEGGLVHDSANLEGLLMLGKGSRLGRQVTVRGTVVIGDNCLIEDYAHLEDAVIWSGTNIEARAVVVDSVIASNCVVKNGTRYTGCAKVAPLASAT